MKNKQPLLSICIPTFNRCDILNDTLKSIINDEAFDDDIEIVISDNFSSDSTEYVCKKYTDSYSNIKYFKNNENISDRNFYEVLGKASGKYLKLINDTIRFKKGMLLKIKEIISLADGSYSIVFPSLTSFQQNKITYEINNKNQLLDKISFYGTWISTFGIWKKDFERICANVDFSTKLVQVEWLFRLINIGPMKIYFDDYYDVFITERKGTYNFFKVFLDNYFGILDSNGVGILYFEKEKYRVYTKHIIPFFYKLFCTKNHLRFDLSSSYSTILKHFWYYPYTYVYFVVYYIFKCFERIK